MKRLFIVLVAMLAAACVTTGRYNQCDDANKKLTQQLTSATAQIKQLEPTEEELIFKQRVEQEVVVIRDMVVGWSEVFVDIIQKNTGHETKVYMSPEVGFSGNFTGALVKILVVSKVFKASAFLVLTKSEAGVWDNVYLHFRIPEPPRDENTRSDLKDTVLKLMHNTEGECKICNEWRAMR